MRYLRRACRFAHRHTWVLWLSALLSIAPAAVLYVGVAGGEMSSSLGQEELGRLLTCARALEWPGLLLLPGWRYPAFWHSHLQSDSFWIEVLQYFGANLVGWFLVRIPMIPTAHSKAKRPVA